MEEIEMARPVVFADLDEQDRKDHTFLDVRVDYITEDTTVGAAVLNLIEACRQSEKFTVSEDGEFKVYLPKTEAERDRALRSAQRQWDWHKEEYEGFDARETQVEQWRRWSLNNWAQNEGLPAPDWEAHDARFAEVAA